MRMFAPALLARLARSGLAAATTKPSLLVTVVMTALAHFTYVALFLILVIAGTGVPIPEDVPLIFSGYMCNHEHSPIRNIPRFVDLDGDGIKEALPRRIPHLYWMIAAGMAGVLAGDSIVFSIGRKGIESNNFVARHLRKVMHSKRREKVERHFAKHGNATIFVGRFMPGFRSIIFAFAGLSKMSYVRFLLIDGLAAGISVPVFVYIGYRFAANIDWLFGRIDQIKHIVLPVVLVLAAGAVVMFVVRRRRAAPAVENLS
jgi:membrane protein DedA with SNARE-associated domain